MQGGRDGFDFGGAPVDRSADDGITRVRYFPVVEQQPMVVNQIQRVMRGRRRQRSEWTVSESQVQEVTSRRRAQIEIQRLEAERLRRLAELDDLDRQARQRARLLENQVIQQIPYQQDPYQQSRPSLPSERPGPAPVVRDEDLVRRVDLSE